CTPRRAAIRIAQTRALAAALFSQLRQQRWRNELDAIIVVLGIRAAARHRCVLVHPHSRRERTTRRERKHGQSDLHATLQNTFSSSPIPRSINTSARSKAALPWR